MKHLLYVTLLALFFTACQNRAQEAKKEMLSIVGTWHYELITQSVQNEIGIDTSYQSASEGMQFYDAFKEDSTLVSYMVLNDSVVSKSIYKYKIINDSIFVKNDSYSNSTYLDVLTDSILEMKYKAVHNDSTFLIQTLSRKCQLPPICQ